MAKIDDLPSKVFHLILRYLDMMERIRLRSVSKTFKKNVDEILGEQTDLVVSSDYTINNRWYHSNEPFSIRDHLILTIDLDLAASFGFNKLKRIKLKAGLQESGLQLLAEKFKKLVQVEVGWLNLKNDATVRFDELQILWIGRIYGAKKFSLTLDAPLLRSVYFGDDAIDHVAFSSQASVRFVEFQLDHSGSSLKFQNCEVIKCSHISSLNEKILCELIKSMPCLTELHCNVLEISNLDYQPDKDDFLKKLFDFLINKHSALPPHRQRALNIFIHHVRITDRFQMPYEQYFFMGILLGLHHRNHEFLPDGIASVKNVDFKKFHQFRVNHQFVLRLNDLYPCIQQVVLIKPSSPTPYRPFIEFLRSRLSVSHLDLQFLGFDSLKKQAFYDELPTLPSLHHSLTKLRLLDNTRPDFSFLFKFELLHHFETNLMTKIDALSTIEKFKHPNFFEFRLENLTLCVEKKTCKNEYCLAIKEGHNTTLYPAQTFGQLRKAIEDSTILTHLYDSL